MFFHTLIISILMAQKLIFVEFFKKSSKIWNFGRYLVLIRHRPLNGPSFFHHLSFFFLSLKCQDTEKACKKKKGFFCFFLWKVHSLRPFYINEPSFFHHVLLFSHSNVKTVRQWLQAKKNNRREFFLKVYIH